MQLWNLTKQKTDEWHDFYLRLAFFWASKSKDTSTKAGCVIVGQDKVQLSAGYNGLPRGIEPTERRLNERPYKYYWHEHSERNAIYNAARKGVELIDSVFYITGPPCASCARGIVSVGASMVVIPKCSNFAGRDDWREILEVGAEILQEGNVRVCLHPIDPKLIEHGKNNPLILDGSGPDA